jgi:hypothetical protein
MMKLMRRVTRETLQLHGGRPLLVSLVPDGCIEIVPEATPAKVYRLGWEEAIAAAKLHEASQARVQRARERR